MIEAPPRPTLRPGEAIPVLRGLDPAEVERRYGCDLVYLIHLDRPLRLGRLAFRHYIGLAHRGNLAQRMVGHHRGSGSKFLRMAMQAGITWHVARVWPGDLREERRIKNMGGASRSCPSCGIVPAAERQLHRGPDGRYVKPPGGTA